MVNNIQGQVKKKNILCLAPKPDSFSLEAARFSLSFFEDV